VRWERLRADALPGTRSAAALLAHLAERIDPLMSGRDELAIRIELAGETPLAQTLRSDRELDALEQELQQKTGALEIQLRNAGAVRPTDRRALRESQTAVAGALELIDRAAVDDRLLDELAPRELASSVDSSARIEYLRELLADLPEELIERSLTAGDA
jgi:hypothetical protein